MTKCYVIIQDTIGRVLEVWGSKNFTIMINIGNIIYTSGSFKGRSKVMSVSHKMSKDEYEITLIVNELIGEWEDNI